MAYIDKELTEGERIVMIGRVSWWTIVPRTALIIAVLFVGGIFGAMFYTAVPVFWIAAVVIGFLLWVLLVAALVFRVLTTEIAITDRRVISKTGLLRTEVKVTPLDKVNNVNVKQSMFGNFLDYGDVEVTTATADVNDNHFVKSLAHTDQFRNVLSEIVQG